MRPILRASSARLIVGHLDPDGAAELLAAVESRGAPLTFALAEPEGLHVASAVPAGMLLDAQPEPVRWGKLVLETVANESIASTRKEFCDAVVDALQVAHRRLGPDGLDLVPRGRSGVGFCAAVIMDGGVQLVIVPPAQVFVVHQGSALCVPESARAGRGIWMRDDLRAEIFAGIGGTHDPDIRVYDAAIGPGDTLVLASSDLARMLTEDDVRLAVTYEDAQTGAERLKQLAIQRGVEAGVALVVEISGTFEREQPSPLSSPIGLSGLPKRPLKIEMPPIGSIFSTARDWLLEAVERVQPAGEEPHPPLAPAEPEDEDVDVGWPSRPAPGAWRQVLQQDLRAVHGGPAGEAPEGAAGASSASSTASSSDFAMGWRHFSRPGGAARQAAAAAGASSAADQRTRHGRGAPAVHGSGSATAIGPGRGGAMIGGAVASISGSLRANGMAGSLRQMSLGAGLQRVRGVAGMGAAALARRMSNANLGSRRQMILPGLGVLAALLLVFGAVRMVKGQQARQLQQRYDSLVTAAAQLEGQARTDSDRNDALGLIKRAQTLLDQADTLQPGRPRVAAIRKDLQVDGDRLDGIVTLPDPSVAVNFGSAGKDINATMFGLDGSTFYALDSGGQRLLQAPKQGGQPSVIATKGDKSGSNQLGSPKLLSMRDGGPVVLDSNRNLWAYTPGAKGPQQIGLKSADSWKDPTAMAAYSPNLYILDASLGNVFRYASRDGIFTDAPTRFFEKDNPDLLKQGISMAIDGSIWVLTSDGQILKLESAARQPFSVTGMAQPLSKPVQIATQAGFRSVYVLDGGNRVVDIGKDGHFARQFKLNLPAPAAAIWPDEPARQLYVLAGGNVYGYSLPA